MPEIKKAGEAARAAGLNVQNGQATASVLDAHRFRSALGDRINWNPAVVMEANDELKDLYFKVGDEIDNTVGPGIRPFNKRCQEALLSQKALKYQLGLQLAGQSRRCRQHREPQSRLVKSALLLVSEPKPIAVCSRNRAARKYVLYARWDGVRPSPHFSHPLA